MRVNVTVVSTSGTKSPMRTLGVESESGVELMATGIEAVIARTVMSPDETAVVFGK